MTDKLDSMQAELGLEIQSQPHDAHGHGKRYPYSARQAMVRAILKGRKQGMTDAEALGVYLQVQRSTAYDQLRRLKQLGILPERRAEPVTPRRTIRVPTDVWEAAQVVAMRNGTTVSGMVNAYLRSVLPTKKDEMFWTRLAVSSSDPTCLHDEVKRLVIEGTEFEICMKCETRLK
jgi:hypothetical protein